MKITLLNCKFNAWIFFFNFQKYIWLSWMLQRSQNLKLKSHEHNLLFKKASVSPSVDVQIFISVLTAIDVVNSLSSAYFWRENPR